MRKLLLTNYPVKKMVPDKMNPYKEIEAQIPFFVKTSILNVMFSPELMLSNADLVRENILAEKIEQCQDDFILLTDEELARLKKAFDAFRGFTRDALELVRRVNEAEVVEA